MVVFCGHIFQKGHQKCVDFISEYKNPLYLWLGLPWSGIILIFAYELLYRKTNV